MKDGGDKYRLLVENLPDGFAYIQVVTGGEDKPADYMFMEVNRAFEEMTGLAKEKLLGKKVTELQPHLQIPLPEWLSSCGEVAFSDGNVRLERYHEPTGRWYEVTAYSDAPGYFATVFRDITDKQMLEEQMKAALSEVRQREKETRGLLDAFRSILECETFEEASRQVFEACCNATGAQAGYVALMNDAGTENEVLFLETGGETCNVDPQLPMPIRGLRSEAYSKAAVVYENDFGRSEWVQFMPAGHVEMRNVMFVPLTISSRVVGVIGLANKPGDFTEDDARLAAPFGDINAIALRRKLDEETLLESETKFRKLAESTEAVLWEYDITIDRWTYVAPQVTRILGYLPEEWTDLQFWVDHIHPDDQGWAVPYCLECTGRGEEHTFEYRFLKKNGAYAWLRDVVSVEIQDGKPVKLRGFMFDITSLKEAQQKIAEYNETLQGLYRQLDEEMEKARRVHERTLPRSLPRAERISLAAHYQPAQKLGGDFYNVAQVGCKLVLYLSDVTGHGLDGAMLSTFIKEAVDSYLSLKPEAIYPAAILRHLDTQYRRENYPDDYFISIFLAVLDLQTAVLSYVSAGFQTSPLVYLGPDEQCELQKSDLPITTAISPELMEFEEGSITLTPGSTILFSTDGLTEQAVEGKLYQERVPKVFYRNAYLPPEAIVRALKDDFYIFNKGTLQVDDDITFLVLQKDPQEKKTLHLELQSNFKELDKVKEEIFRHLPDELKVEAQMLAAGACELAANAMEHGNKLDPGKRVNLELILTEEYACAIVEDEGEGFNWGDRITAPLELRGITERGRGITITRECSEQLFYNDKGNRAALIVTFAK